MKSNKKESEGMKSNNTDYPLTKLLQIYRSRLDLQKAFPEVMVGNLKRLLEWVITCGLTIDSSKEDLLSYEEYYREVCNKNPNNIRSKVPRNLLTEEQTIWDDSKEQYIPGGFKVYWETLNEIAPYQYECGTGDPNMDSIAFSIKLM